jgi:hypothetical protein
MNMHIKYVICIIWNNFVFCFYEVYSKKMWFFYQKNRPENTPIVTMFKFQNAILDKLIWTQPLWLGLFGWFFK